MDFDFDFVWTYIKFSLGSKKVIAKNFSNYFFYTIEEKKTRTNWV